MKKVYLLFTILFSINFVNASSPIKAFEKYFAKRNHSIRTLVNEAPKIPVPHQGFDFANKPDSATKYDNLGSMESRYYYTYNANGLITNVLVKYNFNGFINGERYTFTYNNAGKLTFAFFETFDFGSQVMVPQRRVTVRYASNNELQFVSDEFYNGGVWDIGYVDSVAHVVGANNLTQSFINYQYDMGAYTPYAKVDSIVYNASNEPISFLVEIIDSITIANLRVDNISYGFGYSSILSAFFTDFDFLYEADLAINEKKVTDRIRKEPTQFIVSIKINNVYLPVNRVVSTLTGNRITQIREEEFDLISNTWDPINRRIFSYDPLGNVSQIVAEDWDGVAWESFERQNYQVDAQSFLSHEMVEYWDFLNNAWAQSTTSIYSRQFQGTKMQSCASFIDAQGVLIFLDSIVYHYGNVGLNNISQNIPFVKVFPNPTLNVLFVQFAQQDFEGIVSVYNVNGQVLINKTFDASSLVNQSIIEMHVGDLPSGIYFVVATDKRGGIKQQKFVKN